jgi:hypothetical protein
MIPNTADSHHFIVDYKVMESIPFTSVNSPHNWVRVTPFLWYSCASRHGHEDTGFRTRLVQVLWKPSTFLPFWYVRDDVL